MDVELLAVGAELLLGFTLDRNATHMSRTLAARGVRVTRQVTVPDDVDAIAGAMADGLARADAVIVTGGLGPTPDDVTREAAAAVAGVPLELDEDALAQIRARFTALGRREMPETNAVQAMVPRGASVLPNRRGTAPGLWIETDRGLLVLLPGVPHEMRALLDAEVLPRLAEGGDAVIGSRTVRTTGIAESDLAGRLGDLGGTLGVATLAFLPGVEGVDLRLTAGPGRGDEVAAALERAHAVLRDAVGVLAYGEDEDDLAAVVLDMLRERGLQVAVAESCTGGLVGARLTAIDGASTVFAGGVTSYANASKVRDLDVPADLLEREGAVSEAVVRAMAAGARRRFATEVAVAVSGVAGPGGGTEEKPVGTVCLAAVVGDAARAVTRRFPGGRREIRERAAQAALDMVRRSLLDA
jgi:nicotinamide-nucleotide amidase